MKTALKKWAIRLSIFIFISCLTIVLTILNPGFLYANKTEFGNYTVYHHAELAPEFEDRLAKVDAMIKASEFYDPTYKFRICVDDGSVYPGIIEKLIGPAFGWGFQNIAAFRGAFDYKNNTVELHGYRWNMEQLITHEIMHCLQFKGLGFLQSNPMSNHPDWKWEGYPEYIARKNADQLSLAENIRRIDEARKTDPDAWGVFFEDGTVSPRTYYDRWTLMQYCLEIKGMTYSQVLNSNLSEDSLKQEMMKWYQIQTDGAK